MVDIAFAYFRFQNSFPGPVRVVFLLKPEGVLQRALEVGYRGITENCKYKVRTIFIMRVPVKKLLQFM